MAERHVWSAVRGGDRLRPLQHLRQDTELAGDAPDQVTIPVDSAEAMSISV